MQMGKKKLHKTINVQLIFVCFYSIDTYFLSCNYYLWLKANEWRTQNLVSFRLNKLVEVGVMEALI